MNINYKNLENMPSSISNTISDALVKLKEDPNKETKEGVDLSSIAKKLSKKKFGKKKE